MLQLDALLRLADGARDPGVGDDFPFLGAGAVHPAGDTVGPEQPHQVVLEREEEHALPGVALAARPAAQLAVDAARFVPLGADDHEAAGWVLVAAQLVDLGLREIGPFDLLPERRLLRRDAAHLTLLHAGAELDVGAAAGHAGRDGYGSRRTRSRHDLRFALVLLGVQHLVLQAAPLDHAGQRL